MLCRRLKIWSFVLLGIGDCLGVQAQPGDTLQLSVEQLFELGVANSLVLQADALEEEVAGLQQRTARADRLPDLNVGLQGAYVGQPVIFRRGLSDPYHPDVPRWSQNYAVDVSQKIYSGGRVKYTVRKAELEASLVALQTGGDRSAVKLSLMGQYLELFNLYRQEQVLNRNIEESERRLQDIRRMKREGLITTNDVLRSEMQLTDDQLALQQTRNNLRIASQQLDILLGLEETLMLVPDTTLLSEPLPVGSYESYVAEACDLDPTLAQLRMQTELARNEVPLARSVLLPDLSAYASNTLARPIARTQEDLYNNGWNIGLSLTMPLSNLYKENHRIRATGLGVALRQNAEQQRIQQLRVEVRTAYLRHEEALQEVEALRLSARQARENYRIMQNRYLNQLAILTDLLDANAVLLEVELQLTAARTRVIYTYYQLLEVTGRL